MVGVTQISIKRGQLKDGDRQKGMVLNEKKGEKRNREKNETEIKKELSVMTFDVSFLSIILPVIVRVYVTLSQIGRVLHSMEAPLHTNYIYIHTIRICVRHETTQHPI